MNADQIVAEIREANLSYLMLAQTLIRSDPEQALFFDRMTSRVPAGLSRSGEPVFVNLEFIDGTRGAHINISGISGVATKTTYATFLLYSLFTSGVLGAEATNTKALPNGVASWAETYDPKFKGRLVLPSLPMFLLLPAMLRHGIGFYVALAVNVALTALLYFGMVKIGAAFGMKF